MSFTRSIGIPIGLALFSLRRLILYVNSLWHHFWRHFGFIFLNENNKIFNWYLWANMPYWSNNQKSKSYKRKDKSPGIVQAERNTHKRGRSTETTNNIKFDEIASQQPSPLASPKSKQRCKDKNRTSRQALTKEFNQLGKNNNAKPLSKAKISTKSSGENKKGSSAQSSQDELDLCHDERNQSIDNNDAVLVHADKEGQFQSEYESSNESSVGNVTDTEETLAHQETSDTMVNGSQNKSKQTRPAAQLGVGGQVFDEISDKESFDQYIHNLIDTQRDQEKQNYEDQIAQLQMQLAEKDKIILEQINKDKHTPRKLKGNPGKNRINMPNHWKNVSNVDMEARGIYKSPSDTTIYTPALKQAVDGQTESAHIINQIASVVESIRVSEEKKSRKEAEDKRGSVGLDESECEIPPESEDDKVEVDPEGKVVAKRVSKVMSRLAPSCPPAQGSRSSAQGLHPCLRHLCCHLSFYIQKGV